MSNQTQQLSRFEFVHISGYMSDRFYWKNEWSSWHIKVHNLHKSGAKLCARDSRDS
jgi:hypothetical protein